MKFFHSVAFLSTSLLFLTACAQAPPCPCPAPTSQQVAAAPALMTASSGVVADFAALTLEERVAILPSMRGNLEQDLGLVSGVPRPAESGRNRIITRGLLDGMTIGRGGGAYFSFETGLNDYNQGPDLELQNGKFYSGFYGGCAGAVYRLEGIDFEDVTEAEVPDGLKQSTGLSYSASHEFEAPRCRTGGVYVVRSDRGEEYDVLAVFRILEVDEYGAWFDWRVLRVY